MLDSRLARRDRNSTKVEEKREKRRKKTRRSKEKKKKKRQKKRGEEEAGEKKVEGPWEVNVRLCDHWRMHTLLLFTRLTKLVYTETGTGRRAREKKPPARTSTADLIGFIGGLFFFFNVRRLNRMPSPRSGWNTMCGKE